jgi:hypothetical protein
MCHTFFAGRGEGLLFGEISRKQVRLLHPFFGAGFGNGEAYKSVGGVEH